jgi:hypothetical protein
MGLDGVSKKVGERVVGEQKVGAVFGFRTLKFHRHERDSTDLPALI